MPMRVKRGVPTWTNPYLKPVLMNHDVDGEPHGRVKSAKYIDTSAFFTAKDAKLAEVYNAYMRSPNDIDYARDLAAMMVKKTKNSMKRGGPETAALGYIETVLSIIDEESAQNYESGKFSTFSVGATSDSAYCSICGANWMEDGFCGHWPGKHYEDDDGKLRLCLLLTGDLDYLEQSEVNIPAARKAMVLEIMGPSGKVIEDLDLAYIEKHSTPGKFKYVVIDNSQIDNGGKAMNLQQLIEKLLKDNNLQLSEDGIKSLIKDKKWDLEGEGYKDAEVLDALKAAIQPEPEPTPEPETLTVKQMIDKLLKDNDIKLSDEELKKLVEDKKWDLEGKEYKENELLDALKATVKPAPEPEPEPGTNDDKPEIDITLVARKVKKQYKDMTAAESRVIASSLTEDTDEAIKKAYETYKDRLPTAADLQNLKKSTYFFKREAEKTEDFGGEVVAEKVKDSKFFMIKDSGELTKAVYAMVKDQVSVANAVESVNKAQVDEFKPLESMNDEELTGELNRIEDEVLLRGVSVESRLLDDLTFERDSLKSINDMLLEENKGLKDNSKPAEDTLQKLLRARCTAEKIEMDDKDTDDQLLAKLAGSIKVKSLIDAKNQVANPVLNDVNSSMNSKLINSQEKDSGDERLTREDKLVKDFEGMSYQDIARQHGSPVALEVQKARKRKK